MESYINTIILILLSIISGILGRMGGAEGWNTRYRDIGCSLVAVLSLWFLKGLVLAHWWAYLLIFGLHWGAFSTYWDWLFKFDNFCFSGFMVGLALFPAYWLVWMILVRAIVLALIWGSLNKYLPSKVFIWRRDVAEEFLRYFSVPLTLIII